MLSKWILSLAFISSCAFATPQVEFETTLGNFTVTLNQDKAPLSVANFVKYVEDGSYVGSQFHRIIPGFMAQGGGFDKDLAPLATYAPIKNEAENGLKNNLATIAMARTNDPNSATRQFFINLNDNDFLNASPMSDGYAVFGLVTQGFSTIKKMAQQPTHSVGMMQDIPTTPIIITKATLIP